MLWEKLTLLLYCIVAFPTAVYLGAMQTGLQRCYTTHSTQMQDGVQLDSCAMRQAQ